MPRGGIGFARERLPARGDALIGQRGAPGVVRDEVGEVKTRAGKLPGGGGVVGVRLELRLRALKFRLGAGGENWIARFAGENNSAAAARKIAAASPPLAARRVLGLRIAIFGIKSCHRIGLIYTGQVRLNWNLSRGWQCWRFWRCGAPAAAASTPAAVGFARLVFSAGADEGRSPGGDQRAGGGVRPVPTTRSSPIILCDSHLR